MKITIIGTGYVGLVTGSCLSDYGHNVICSDVDEAKIAMLNAGHIPIYEPGLKDIIDKNVKRGHLSFTSDVKQAISSSSVIFIAVGTPERADGSANLDNFTDAVQQISLCAEDHKYIVNKSTVPVGTGRRVKDIMLKSYARQEKKLSFDVISNPEFLREGSAVYDFMHPDRIIIGTESEAAESVMKEIYRVLYLNETPFIFTNLETSEMIKYASNAFLAMKVTFINEIANLCEKTGADVKDVARAMGKDGRIGPKFLHPGPGYGGSCFPKDTKALSALGREHGSPVTLIETVITANETQQRLAFLKIKQSFPKLKGKVFAVLGLSFKPNTDDIRESPALTIIRHLLSEGARVQAYDPAAVEAASLLFPSEAAIQFASDEYSAMKDADGMVVATEWNQFRNLDFHVAAMLLKGKHVFDLRNIYQRTSVEKSGLIYHGTGQPQT